MPVTLALKLTWILNICCFPMFSSHAIKMILQLPWFSAFHLWTTATKYIHSQINMNDEKASGRGAVTIHLWVHLKYNYIDGETSSVLLRPLKRHLITHCACNTTVTLDRLWRFVCVCVFMNVCQEGKSERTSFIQQCSHLCPRALRKGMWETAEGSCSVRPKIEHS